MQNKELVKINDLDLSDEQITLISKTIAVGATQDELSLFVGQCKRTRLDPFSRQIYFIKDKSGRVMTQISVDGFRVIAERSGDYAGQDAPVFEEDKDGKLIKCSVTIYRWHGETRYPASIGVAYWKEYYRVFASGPSTWDKMPHTMLSKVAECIALRKAFPNDLSGLYAPEEMDQATIVEVKNVKKNDVEKPIDIKPENVVEPFPSDVSSKHGNCNVAECGGVMNEKDSPKGKVLACSNYPRCKNIMPL